MYRVQISHLARTDLLDALEYIGVDLENPSAAERIGTTILQRIAGVRSSCICLSEFCQLGRVADRVGAAIVGSV